MSTKQVLIVSPQWLEREIHGSTFLMYLFFRECTGSGIFRSIYFHILILILNLWYSLVSKETGEGYYEKLGTKILLYFSLLYPWDTNSQVWVRIKESRAGETPKKCEVQFKSWNTGWAEPHNLTEWLYNTGWHWFNSTCINTGLSEIENNVTMASLFQLNHGVSTLMLDISFFYLIICPWSLSVTGSLVFLWFTYWNRTTSHKIKSNIFVCIKTL